VRDRLFAEGIRVEADLSDETMRYKIRNAQSQQVPYMLVVGEREQSEGTVSVRHRRRGDFGSLPLDAFLAQVNEETTTHALDKE
jgi:threonyl-tRNA synthetase